MEEWLFLRDRIGVGKEPIRIRTITTFIKNKTTQFKRREGFTGHRLGGYNNEKIHNDHAVTNTIRIISCLLIL